MAKRIPIHIKQALTEFVTASRSSYKAFRQSYGSKVIGKSTIDGVLSGSVGIPVLFTPNISLSTSLSSPKSMNIVHTYFAEQVLGRVNTMESIFSEEYTQNNSRHESFFPLQVKYSLQLLRLQPQSAFYNYRHSILKTAYWELVWEDIVDICALSMIWHQHANSATTKASFDPIIASKMIISELQSSSIAPDDPHIHTLRLASSTLSDPFLASSAMLTAMKAKEYATEELFFADLKAKLLQGLFTVWIDRVLMLPLSNPKSIDLVSLQAIINTLVNDDNLRANN